MASAARGDRGAREQLVAAYASVIWIIGRSYRLDASDVADVADVADVSQTTWLRLVEHIDRLHEPGRVGSWLAATARRECLRVLTRRQHRPDTRPLFGQIAHASHREHG